MTNRTRLSSCILAWLTVTLCLFWASALGVAAPPQPSTRPASVPAIQPRTAATTQPVKPPSAGSLKQGLTFLFHGSPQEKKSLGTQLLWKGATLASDGTRGTLVSFQKPTDSLVIKRPFVLNNLTLGFWVRLQPGKEGAALAAFLDKSGNWAMQLNLSSGGNPMLALFNSRLSRSKEIIASSTRVSGSKWIHLAVVIDVASQQTSLVVNGKIAETMKFLPTQRSYFLHLGKTSHASTSKGFIHEVSVHKRALSAGELARLGSVSLPLRTEAGRLSKGTVQKGSSTGNAAPNNIGTQQSPKTQKELLYPTKKLPPYKSRALHSSLQFLLHCDQKEWKYLFTRFILRRLKSVATRWHGKACAFNGRNAYLRTDQKLLFNNVTLQFWFRPRKKGGGLFSLQHPSITSLKKGKTPKLAWGWQIGLLDNGVVEVNAFHDKQSKTYTLNSKSTITPGLWHHFALNVSPTFKTGKTSKIRVKLYLNGRLQASQVWPAIQHTGQGYVGGSPHFGYFHGEIDDLAFFAKMVPENAIRWYASARSPLTRLVDPKADARRNSAEEQNLSPAEFVAYKGAAIDTFKRGIALSKKAARQSSASLWKIAQEMLQTSQQMLTIIVRKGGKLPKGLDFRMPIDLPPAPITRAAPPAR